MTKGIKAMYDLGFIETQGTFGIVRQFTKYDEKGYITDIINFIGSKGFDIDVFTNSLKNQCGSRLDKDLLNAINLNMLELEGK